MSKDMRRVGRLSAPTDRVARKKHQPCSISRISPARPDAPSDEVMELRRRLASFSIAEPIGSQETQND
jgi:hypothetical protein